MLSGSRGLTRRQWLTRWLVVGAGVILWPAVSRAQQLPPGAGMAAMPSCDPNAKLTPARVPAEFRAGAPTRSRLIERGEVGTVLSLTGTVVGIRCGLIAGASIDIWHADGTGAMAATGMRFRGRQITDAQGRYTFETIVPGAVARQAPRVNVRVTVPGKTTFATTLFLPDVIAAAANAKDATFDPLLAMTLLSRTAERIQASFNVILDL